MAKGWGAGKSWRLWTEGGVPVLGGVEQDSWGFHHPTQNGTPFKTYELLDFGITHSIFSDCGEGNCK